MKRKRTLAPLKLARLIAPLAAIAGFAAMLPAGAVPSPVQRPHGDFFGNGPSTNSDDLKRLIDEIARRKAEQEQLSGKQRLNESERRALQANAIKLAKTVQDKERAVSAARENLAVLSLREAKIRGEFNTQRAHLAKTLGALELLQRQRPPALAVQPGDAAQAARSSMLLGEIIPRFKAQAEALGKQLADLKVIRDRIETEQKALNAAADALKGDQQRLETLLSEKRRERDAIRAASRDQDKHLAELAKRAENLTALLSELRRDGAQPKSGQAGQRPAPEGGAQLAGLWSSPGAAARSFASARGQLKLPAVGKVVAKFGVPNESGGNTKGIRIAALPGAHVVVPFDGRVKYAGPLKTYGQVLIVEAGDDYLMIMAGLARVDAAVGQWLLSGEPVGRMADVGEEGPKELYLEFRKGLEPFDPLPWLAGVTKEG